MADSNKHSDQSTNPKEETSFSGEYRIIPVEGSESSPENDAINIQELFRSIGDGRNFIYIITGICLILGILYALSTPVEYKSEAMVMPEVGEKKSQLGSLIQNYGGILGSTGSLDMSSDGKISPQVYPEIFQSLNFQHAMLDDTVYFADNETSLTLFQYFKNRVGPFYEDWIGIDEYSSDMNTLPAPLRQQINTKKISSVTKEELQVINVLRERIDIEFDTGTGVMRVTAQIPDAYAAAQVCNNAINLLTKHVKEYRTQKAQNVLDFAEEQYQIGQQRFRNAQSVLANFKDENVNLSSAKAQSRLQYLEAEFDIAYNVYNNVAQKRIQARINLQENMPVFKVVQPANVPLERAQPQWVPVIIFSIAVGLLISFLIIAGRMILHRWNVS